MAADRQLYNSGSSPPVTGDAYMDDVREEVQKLWDYAFVPLTNIGGTANAITADSSPATITTYANGMGWTLRPTSSVTGAATINIDARGVVDFVDNDGAALKDGMVRANGIYLLRYNSTTGDVHVLNPDKAVGKQELYIRAGDITSRTTSGPAAGSVETTTNKVMLTALDFDQTTEEYAQFSFRAPKRWNEGTMTARFHWFHSAGSGSFGVVWAIHGLALANDDAGDTAFGTAVTITDTGGTANDIYISDETAAFTLGNTPTEGDFLVFQIYRDAANGSDTLNADARLLGVTLHWTSNAVNEA